MGILFDLLKDLPVSAALAERIKIIEAETLRIREENMALQEEKADLLKKNVHLEQELSELKAPENKFVEYSGVKFREISPGKYNKTIPYCPDCRKAMFINRNMSRATHECSLCGFRAPFTARQLAFVTKTL